MQPGSVSTSSGLSHADELVFAREILTDQSVALSNLANLLDPSFSEAVSLIVACERAGGTVLVTGLGKSGLVGAKIAATLSSLGIPAHSVHPSEAFHGDLGRFRSSDTVICISASGETGEVVSLASVLRQDGLSVIAITARGVGNPSSLERLASVAIRLHIHSEAGGFPAPTSSTTATLAMGDCLGLAAARRMNFTQADFQRRHPGGTLGELLRPIRQALRTVAGKNLILVSDHVTVSEALALADQAGRRPGALILIDQQSGKMTGLFTDGDLRRLIRKDTALLARPIKEVMTRTPRTLHEDSIIDDAVKMFREFRQDEIPVVDAEGKPVGMLDVQDLIALKLVRD